MATSRSRRRHRKEKARPEYVFKGLYYGKINYLLMALGLILVLIGFIFLYIGDTVISVLSLTIGYVILIPIGLYLKPREEASG